MAKHPTSRKTHRTSDEDDAFVARLIQYGEWAKRHSRIVITGAVIVLLLIAGLLYYRNYQVSMREQAETALADIQQTAASGNRALAMRDLESFVEAYSGTPAGGEGRLLLGELYLAEAQYVEAADAVDDLAEDLDEPLGTPAAFMLGAALEGADRPDDAEDVYLRIGEDAPMEYQQVSGLADAARVRLGRGDAAGAAELYEQVLARVGEDSPRAGEYRMRLAEARAASEQSGDANG